VRRLHHICISSFDTGRVLAQKRSMTDSDDAVVTEIIREIAKHGASAGVTFRQTVGGSTPARYPPEAVLTAVRMLAEAADADHSPMGAELRAMIEHVDPNLPIEIVYPGAGPVNCGQSSGTSYLPIFAIVFLESSYCRFCLVRMASPSPIAWR
jgi:hypothetical protein